MSARIEVTSGPLAGKAFPVRDATFSIGREAGNDLVLEDSTVSRRHVLIVPDATGAAIRDLGSRNGILLDGKPAREGRLQSGTAFSVGRVACRYVAQDSPAAAPAPQGAAPARVQGPDRRFALVLSVAAVLVAAILFLWYRKAHRTGPAEIVVVLMQGDERYQPSIRKSIRDYQVRDLKGDGIVKILRPYKNALAFRAMAQGDCDIDLLHDDGTKTVLKVSVHGVKPPPVGMEIPPDVQGDAAKEEEFFRRKMAEAVAHAAGGRLRDALIIARATEGYYYNRMPKPPVATEARDQAQLWEERLQGRLNELEEERRHQSENRNYEAVDKTLWAMRELVEEKSADHQRLRFLFEINDENLRKARPAR